MGSDLEEIIKELIGGISDEDIIEIGEIIIRCDEFDRLVDEIISRVSDDSS